MQDNLVVSNLKNAIIENYLPYAASVVIARAIPAIDGLKPSNRRILYTMYKMGLLNKKTKSANVVGQTMKLHPHGDMAIYETLVRMTDKYEGLNIPYVIGKGSFGKSYMKDIEAAAPRYTEVGLSDIAKELFEGINEGVPFVSNYDGTEEEPLILPVKLPTILINNTSGIAVGMSSNIPTFYFGDVIDAVIKMLEYGENNISSNEIKDLLKLEFPTGGIIYWDENEMERLILTGKGTFTIEAVMQYNKKENKIEIFELPYRVSAEDIIDDVKSLIYEDILFEVSDIKDVSGLDGFKIEIYLKRGADISRVYHYLVTRTKLRTTISFNTQVILIDDNKFSHAELGIYDLLREWIKFRKNILKKRFNYLLNVKIKQEELLRVWEIIDVLKVVTLLRELNEDEFKQKVYELYQLNDRQIDYLLDRKLRDFNKVDKYLKELESVRGEIEELNKLLNDDNEVNKYIIRELNEIKDKYSYIKRRTKIEYSKPEITFNEEVEKEEEDYEISLVIIKKDGRVGRYNIKDFVSRAYDSIEDEYRFSLKKNQCLYFVMSDGYAYRVYVKDIILVKKGVMDSVNNILNNYDIQLLYVIPENIERVIVVGSNGSIKIIKVKDILGSKKVKVLDNNLLKSNIVFTDKDRFYVYDADRNRAAYIDINYLDKFYLDRYKIEGSNKSSKLIIVDESEVELSDEQKEMMKFKFIKV